MCLYTEAGTDVAVDLVAEVPANSDYVAAGPQRILETRAEAGQVGYTGGKHAAGQVIEVQVTGVGAAAVPTAASALPQRDHHEPVARRVLHRVPVRDAEAQRFER